MTNFIPIKNYVKMVHQIYISSDAFMYNNFEYMSMVNKKILI